jgi:enoyl-[acyl-carrier protein] reductase I
MSRLLDWKARDDLPLGKGATVQAFIAEADLGKFEISVAPWGEGHLRLNGREIAHVSDAKTRRRAFHDLNSIADRYLTAKSLEGNRQRSLSMIPIAKAKLLEGKRGLVVGIANDQSIAWGCAKAFRALGAELAVTYLNEKAKKYVEPLAIALDAQIVMPLDVQMPGQMEAVFDRIGKTWDRLDFVVHSIAFSPKEALQGRVIDVTRDGFLTTMDVSCWTFLRMAHLAEPLMRKGGTLFTMTYYGSQTVVKNYNIMGVAKAALESAVRYVAAELGPKGIRVHAISPGPLATRAASGIPEFDALLDKAKSKAPARSLVSIDDVGAATAFLAHDAARLITGETLYVDGGYHIID